MTMNNKSNAASANFVTKMIISFLISTSNFNPFQPGVAYRYALKISENLLSCIGLMCLKVHIL